MSKKSKTTATVAGDFISEDAVRRTLGRRRRSSPASPPDETNGLPADRPTADPEASSPAKRTTPLRRWSVAELIARAAASRPADGMSH
jgi:hypothetical protein